ncbi:MAG: lysylphosphatidylglycerol synthase domain-containing protein [Thermoleophilia bacterium]
MAAFNITPSLSAAVLVQVASSAATSLPATPGGLGPKQALLVVLLAGEAAREDVLAFSVGMELTTLAVNVVIGLAAMSLMVGGLHVRRAIAEARNGGPPA